MPGARAAFECAGRRGWEAVARCPSRAASARCCGRGCTAACADRFPPFFNPPPSPLPLPSAPAHGRACLAVPFAPAPRAQHENSGHVACVARQDADKQTILEAVTWACDNANPPIPQCDADANGRVLNASQIFTQSWHAARLVGGTCDFNGAAELADLDTIGLVIVKDNTTVAQRKPAPPPDVEEEMSAEQLARAVAPLDGDTPEAIAARTAMVAAKAVKTAAAAGGTSPPLLSMERLAAYGRGSHGRSPAALAAPLAAVALLALAVVGARAGARSWRARRAAAGDYAWAEEGGSDGGIRLGLVGRRDGERLLASGLVDNGA